MWSECSGRLRTPRRWTILCSGLSLDDFLQGVPMDASELLKTGKLGAAIDAQLAAVKAHPADGNRRLFLFEMLLFTGDIDRAAKQGALVKFPEVEINAAMD